MDKRVERAKVRLREYLTAKVEADLRDVQPKGEFTKRTLAAIPVGSICGELGLNAAKVGVAEALQHLAHAGAQKASTILTGGAVMTSKQVITAGAAVLLLAAGIGTYIARDRGESGPEEPAAIAALEKDMAAARGETERTRAEVQALSEEKAALEKEVARQEASADAAWGSRQALFDELAALETKLNEELEKLAKSEEKGEEKDETDLDGKPLMEAMKAMFTRDFMKTALRERKSLAMQVKMEYGKFLDEYVQDPAQRAEVEAIISEALQAKMGALIDAFGAYPDMSKFKNLKANQEADSQMLTAAVSTVLDGAQTAAFEDYVGGEEERFKERLVDMHLQIPGIELNGEERAAFSEIVSEETRSTFDPTWADPEALERFATMTIGDVIREQKEQVERIALRLAEVLPPEEVAKYRAFAERQIQMLKMQLEMFSGSGAAAR